MRHQDQITQACKLLSYLDTRTTAMADSIYRKPISDYTCPQQAARGREVFFRRGPVNLRLGCPEWFEMMKNRQAAQSTE